MIYDSTENLKQFSPLTPAALELIRQFLERTPDPAAGRHELDGDRLFANVSEYLTEPDGVFELHRRYADLQMVTSGCERQDVAPAETLAVVQPYSGQDDCALFRGDATGSFQLKSALFSFYAPGEPHRPGLAVGAPEPVKKIVFKIASELLQ